MPMFNPSLVAIMRDALDQVMLHVPAAQATAATKAHVAEVILKAAADGVTSYDGLVSTAVDQLPVILSLVA